MLHPTREETFMALILLQCLVPEKKEDSNPVTKAQTPTEKSKKQRDNIKTPPKSLITQRLRSDLGRSVGVKAVIQLVWTVDCAVQFEKTELPPDHYKSWVFTVVWF